MRKTDWSGLWKVLAIIACVLAVAVYVQVSALIMLHG